MRLINAMLYLEDRIILRGFIEIQNEIITDVGEMGNSVPTESSIDLSGFIIAPGFIDQHIHGAVGVDVMDATSEGLNTISRYLVREGVTSFLATTTTMSTDKIHQSLKTVASFTRQQFSGQGAELLGAHLEGPFINRQFKGAQNEAYIKEPDIELYEAFRESSRNYLKIVTYAAENDPEHTFLKHLKQTGVVPSCGHSAATFEEVEKCAIEGLQCLTHFHNATSGHHHRQPGVVTAGFCLDSLRVEIIADAIHLHPAVLKMVYRMKGKDSIILITDSLCAKGLPDGNYELGEQPFIKRGQTCHLNSGVLAGSILSMDTAVRNMVKFTGCTLAEAVQMASLNPARLLGVDARKGSIAPGKDADLVVLDQQGNLQMTIVRGKVGFKLL